MKKIIYVCLAFCLATTLATSQKLAQKDLQGTWKMVGLESSGVHLDLNTGVVTIDKEVESQLTPEQVTGIREGMKQAIVPLSMSSVSFDGANFKQNMAGQEQNGTYTISEMDNRQYLDITAGGMAAKAEVAVVDKKLRITQSEGTQQATFIYTKQ